MRNMSRLLILVTAAVAVGFVPVASAQEDTALPGAAVIGPSAAPNDSGEDPMQFGGNYFIKIIPGIDFVGTSNTSTATFSGSGYFTAVAGGIYWAPVDMPPGTEVAQVCLFGFDGSATQQISAQWGIYHMGDATGNPGFINIGTASTGGATVPNYTLLCIGPGTTAPIRFRAFADVDGDGTPDYNWHRFNINVPVDNTIRWGGAYVQWRRTISPAPATATFPNDVPTTSGIFRFVEALAAAGITAGCAPGSYCPDSPLTRGQMAVFLTAGLGLYWPN